MTKAVLITDAEKGSVLAACRGLAEAGYRVGAASAFTLAPAQWSRACEERIALPDPRAGAAAFAGRLEEILRGDRYDVLLPGTEASLLAVSEHRERLELHVRLGLPPHEAVERCLDKLVLAEAATQAGLSPPESAVCERAEDALQAALRIGYPVIAKPARSLIRGGVARYQNAVVAGDEHALEHELGALGTPFLLQRYESTASLISCSGVIADGGLRALCVARYRRTWPPLAGPSCFSETIEPPAGLGERVEALVERLSWRGIFQVQLLHLGPSRFATLDLNPRVFGSLGLAVRAEANLPAIWCELLLGGDPPFAAALPGVRYRWEEGDARHLLWQLRRGRLATAGAVALPRRRVTHAYFRLADPLPAAAAALGAIRRVFARAR